MSFSSTLDGREGFSSNSKGWHNWVIKLLPATDASYLSMFSSPRAGTSKVFAASGRMTTELKRNHLHPGAAKYKWKNNAISLLKIPKGLKYPFQGLLKNGQFPNIPEVQDQNTTWRQKSKAGPIENGPSFQKLKVQWRKMPLQYNSHQLWIRAMLIGSDGNCCPWSSGEAQHGEDSPKKWSRSWELGKYSVV